jgi:ABC-type nitrate/sulfonate/bicarbonate transport system substrate-binding protein
MPRSSLAELKYRSRSSRRWRAGSALALAAACATFAAACSSSSSSSSAATSGGASAPAAGGASSAAASGGSGAMTTIRLSNTLIAGDEIPLVYGDSIGIWKKYGINLVEQNVSTAIQYTSLGAGQADIATGSPGSIEAAVGGAPVKIIGGIGNDVIEMLAQKDIPNTAGLKGTTLGSSAPGSVTAGIIKTYLGQQGLAASDYKISYFSGSFPAVITALEAGRISATTAGYPYIAQAKAANPGLHAVATISSTPIGILGGNMMTVNTGWAAKNGPAIKQFVAAWNEATKESKANPQAAIAALAKATKVSTAIATQWFDQQSPLDGWFPLTTDQYKIIIDSLTAQYPNVASAKFSDVVDNSYVQG